MSCYQAILVVLLLQTCIDNGTSNAVDSNWIRPCGIIIAYRSSQLCFSIYTVSFFTDDSS